jgi:hypothetical protein
MYALRYGGKNMMRGKHIVVVYEDANGNLQVTPGQLEVYSGDPVMFFSEKHDLEVDFNASDTPFDPTHTQLNVQAASYMVPEPVIEKPSSRIEHHYTIVASSSLGDIVKQIDPVIIVDPYPLRETKIINNPKNQRHKK